MSASPQLLLRLPDDLGARVAKSAAAHHVTRQELVRRVLDASLPAGGRKLADWNVPLPGFPEGGD